MFHTCTLLPILTLIITWWHVVVGSDNNLLKNPSFETQIRASNWKKVRGGKLFFETRDVLDGRKSLKCIKRKQKNSGISQNIPFKKGRHYQFEGYVKLLNDKRSKPFQHLVATIQMTLPNIKRDKKTQSYLIAKKSYCTSKQGWILLKGDIEAPQADIKGAKLNIMGPDPEINLLFDKFSLRELPENRNWRSEAHANIERTRKSNATLTITNPSGDDDNVDIEISLRNHEFAFGSLFHYKYVLDLDSNSIAAKVFDIATSLFNMATVQDYKWKFNRGDDKNPDFSRATEMTRILRNAGLRVRGHSVFWDVKKNIPDFIKSQYTKRDLVTRLNKHLLYMLRLANGTLVHWDVVNEHIAGQYFEEKTNNPYITRNLYRKTEQLQNRLNDKAERYMNEYQCITSGAQTQQFYELAKSYLDDGINIQGLGCQGHTKDFVKPDPTAMWRRINLLSQTGLDIYMTEFDIGWPDKSVRADWFEDAIRAFFGHPAMKGVVLWGFNSLRMRELDHELVTGVTFEEPGKRWSCLVNNEWTTKLNFNLKDRSGLVHMRGFKGEYQVVVKRNGIAVQRELFTLTDKPYNFNLKVTKSEDAIEIPVKNNYVPDCVSHRDEKTLGSEAVPTTETYKGITCRYVESEQSGRDENDAISVSCDDGEIMTGCSSYREDKKWTRKGERIVMQNGRLACTAYNGHDDSYGVKAAATCCKAERLACDYRFAGPSFHFKGAKAEARCSSGQMALGCSTYSYFPDSNGIQPNENLDSCIAESDNPLPSKPAEKSGTEVSGACCSANGLQCIRIASPFTDLNYKSTQSIQCSEGQTMTSCNAHALNGKSGGAKVINSSNSSPICEAYMGDDVTTGLQGVQAVATCCVIA